MKLKVEILDEQKNKVINKKLLYDEEVTKGLYLVGSPKYIRKNKKSLGGGDWYVGETKKDKLAQITSKGYDFVVLTLYGNEGWDHPLILQFIIQESCNDYYLETCNHYLLTPFKDVLRSGIDLLTEERHKRKFDN